MPPAEAARTAAAVRLRPILLTTLAIILGSAIMIPDPVFGGLAISLIFGTLVSTALTVFVVPLLYERFAPADVAQPNSPVASAALQP
jgi:multidrug efflux pump subunit AcrB